MSSEVQLTDEQVDAIVKGLARVGRPDYRECVRAGEQAVRAQWAAEAQNMAYIHAFDQGTIDLWKQRAETAEAERDSAQAEAKRLREALERIWQSSGQSWIRREARIALQPGASHE